MAAIIIKPETYDGADPELFTDWFTRFTMIATVNWWDGAKQLAILPTLLTQRAFTAFKELATEEKDTLEHIKTNMINKLLPAHLTRVWKMQMRALRRERGESVDDFVLRLKKLAEKAYRGTGGGVKNEAIREQFILGQGRELEYELLKADNNETLEQLIIIARKIEAAAEITKGGNL